MYKVSQVKESIGLAKLITIASENTYHEYDCDRNTYINHIVKNMYLNDSYRMLLLYNDETVIGYFICRRDNFLYNELIVVDVFVKKEYQGNSCIQLFLKDIAGIVFEIGVKRIKWHSHIFGADFWGKHSFGFEVKKYEMFCVELEGKKEEYKESIK